MERPVSGRDRRLDPNRGEDKYLTYVPRIALLEAGSSRWPLPIGLNLSESTTSAVLKGRDTDISWLHILLGGKHYHQIISLSCRTG